MKKELVIKLSQYEYAIAMQVQNQVGNFLSTKHVKFSAQPELCDDYICLWGANKDANRKVCVKPFNTEEQKNDYYIKVLNWIAYELFTLPKNPTVGYPCIVSENLNAPTENWVYTPELLCILPEDYQERFIVRIPGDLTETVTYKYAKVIPQIIPEQLGDVFTWKLEVRNRDEK